jgi:hypothetical protein
MRLFSTALITTVAVALLAGCSGNMSQSSPSLPSGGIMQQQTRGSHIPHWAYPANTARGTAGAPAIFRRTIDSLHKRTSSDKGIYASMFYGSDVYGYPSNNSSNGPPTCSVATGEVYINGIAVDGKGNLITPYGESSTGERIVVVWTGPGMCGSELGSFEDPYGQGADATSADAATGTIAVGNIYNTSDTPGSIAICTISGCTADLTSSSMDEVAGVAMDNSGNCWASAVDSSGAATLTYFAGCTGSGQQATGFMNSDYGGLDIDKSGNIVSLDYSGERMWVYSGCNPTCTLVGGPFTLHGDSVFGHLNKQSMAFVAGDFSNGEEDVYSYSPSAVTYMYSFDNGLDASLYVEGAAYNPRSSQ